MERRMMPDNAPPCAECDGGVHVTQARLTHLEENGIASLLISPRFCTCACCGPFVQMIAIGIGTGLDLLKIPEVSGFDVATLTGG